MRVARLNGSRNPMPTAMLHLLRFGAKPSVPTLRHGRGLHAAEAGGPVPQWAKRGGVLDRVAQRVEPVSKQNIQRTPAPMAV